MYVRHLSLADFRSWKSAELALEPGVTVLVGQNGSGKTNLVEALGYLATLSSHRVASDVPLVARGTEQALIRAAVVSGGRELLLETEINVGRANRARINRAPLTRVRDLLGVLRTVLFAPEDLALVRGDPAERRRFLDEVLVMRAPRFAGIKSDYDRIVKQRSALLKSAGSAVRRGGDLSTLDVWNQQLATTGAQLTRARLELVQLIRPHLTAAYADLAPASEPVDAVYRPSTDEVAEVAGQREADSLTSGDAAASGRAAGSDDEIAAALLAAMQRLRQAELDRGVCLVGPHRDDLELRLGAGQAKGFASHGESWSLALALKLGGFGLLRSDGVDPVLILDDVFAELDTSRRDCLVRLVADADQVLITAAVPGDVPEGLGDRRFRVADGIVAPMPEKGVA